MASECHFLLFFMYAVMGICAPALKSLNRALPNVYLESFLGSMDAFTRSTDAQLVVSY